MTSAAWARKPTWSRIVAVYLACLCILSSMAQPVEVPVTVDGQAVRIAVPGGVSAQDAAAQFCARVQEVGPNCVGLLVEEIQATRAGAPVPRYSPEDFARIVAALGSAVPRPLVLQVGAHVGNTANDPVFPQLAAAGSSWRGLLVEPVPHLFRQLVCNYVAADGRAPDDGWCQGHGAGAPKHSRVSFAMAAVCPAGDTGTVPFFYVADTAPTGATQSMDLPVGASPASQLGSLDRGVLERVAPAHLIVETAAVCRTIPQLLADAGLSSADVDYFQVDAEGADWGIVRGAFADPSFRPRLLRFEWKHLSPSQWTEARELLEGPGAGVVVDTSSTALLGGGLGYECCMLGGDDLVCRRGDWVE